MFEDYWFSLPMKKFILVFLILVIILLGYPISVGAHPADMYYHTHLVTLSAENLYVIWEVMPGPMIAQSIWFAADQDQDDQVSAREAVAWAGRIVGTFSAELDQEPLDLDLEQVLWPDTIDELYQGDTPIRIYLRADWPGELGQPHLLSLHNRFNPKSSLSWFEVIAEDGLGFDQPSQNSGTLEISFGLGWEGWWTSSSFSTPPYPLLLP